MLYLIFIIFLSGLILGGLIIFFIYEDSQEQEVFKPYDSESHQTWRQDSNDIYQALIKAMAENDITEVEMLQQELSCSAKSGKLLGYF